MRKILFFGILLLAFHGTVRAQQHPVFSQYYFNEMVINPAYAGNHLQFSATTMYRNQWVNFPGAPRTFNFSTHTSLLKNKIGVGFLINHDEIGSYRNEHVYGSYAYKIHFGASTLSMGLQAGFNVLAADYSKLDLQNPAGDPSFFNIANVLKPNFGGGLFYSTRNFFLGFSVPYIMNNKVNSSVGELVNGIKEARYYFMRGGAILPLTRDNQIKINPSALVRAQEGQPLSFDLNNAFIFYDSFSAGTSYRLGDSFIIFVDIKISEKIHFGYSYDMTSSDIRAFSNGTHEFMLNFRSVIRKIHGNPECPSYYNYR